MTNFNKTVGVIGLGKMGAGIAKHLQASGVSVVGFDTDETKRDSIQNTGVAVVENMAGLKESGAEVFWISVPHAVVDAVLDDLLAVTDNSDIIIDAGNSFFKNTQKRAAKVRESGVQFVDAGVSGGPTGAREGAAIMVGGVEAVVSELSSLFEELAVTDGFSHVGPAGAGHFVKMVHNGIEYQMLQAIGEGAELLKKGPYDVDLEKVASVYQNGSVIESKLISQFHEAIEKFDLDFSSVSAKIGGGSTGGWALDAAKEADTTHSGLESAVSFRKHSQNNESFAGKVINAIRHIFGGHPVSKTDHEGE